MAKEMTSRDRILAALSLKEPDRVPIAMRRMEPMEHLWKDRFERALFLRDRFGIDDFITVGHAWPYDPSVKEERTWKTWGEKAYPLLVTDYQTPAGTLHAEVMMTEDYRVDRLRLDADQLVPRMVDRPIKGRDDVARFRYLLGDPTCCNLAAWDETVRNHVAFGRSEGFPIGFYMPSISGIAMKNIGVLEIVVRAADGDPLVEELLDALLEWTLQWLD